MAKIHGTYHHCRTEKLLSSVVYWLACLVYDPKIASQFCYTVYKEIYVFRDIGKVLNKTIPVSDTQIILKKNETQSSVKYMSHYSANLISMDTKRKNLTVC